MILKNANIFTDLFKIDTNAVSIQNIVLKKLKDSKHINNAMGMCAFLLHLIQKKFECIV
jgi:hypothetical protein